MKKIVILNAYGQKNIGDEAIQYSAFSLLNSTLSSMNESAHVTVLCEDPVTFPTYTFNTLRIEPILMPYGYALRYVTDLLQPLQKIVIAIKILLTSAFYVLLSFISPTLLPSSGTYYFIRAIYEADRVIGIGGGYLISKSAIKDFYGLSLTLLPIVIAKLYRKKVLHLPISVGPFGSEIHELLTFHSLKNTQVYLRENISYDLLKKYSTEDRTELQIFPDLALFLENPNKVIRENSYWVITAREWLPEKQQEKYEKALASLIDFVWENFGIKSVFVVMVKNLEEDNDEHVYKRLVTYINNKQSLLKYVPKNHQMVQLVLSNAIFSVCTRMHSAILSLTVNCPFLTIGYGHKGKGFMESIGLSKWYLDISSVTKENLFSKFNAFFNSKNIINLKDNLKSIKSHLDTEKIVLKQDLREYLSS